MKLRALGIALVLAGAIGGFGAGYGVGLATAPTPLPEPTPFAVPASLTDGFLPCTTEDSTAPCYWDAEKRGNGIGRSFTVMPDGTVRYWPTPN